MGLAAALDVEGVPEAAAAAFVAASSWSVNWPGRAFSAIARAWAMVIFAFDASFSPA